MLACALVACSAVPTHYTVRRVDGPVTAYCRADGPCADTCGDRPGCVCRCAVDGLTDHVAREIVLADYAGAEVAEHERCHAAGGSEEDCGGR